MSTGVTAAADLKIIKEKFEYFKSKQVEIFQVWIENRSNSIQNQYRVDNSHNELNIQASLITDTRSV